MGYLARLISFFLVIAIIWGLLAGIPMGIYLGVSKGIFYGITLGIIFSFVITSVGAYYDYIFRKWVFKKFKVTSFDLWQNREVYLKGDLKSIFRKAINTLNMIPGIRKVSPDPGAKKILASTNVSLLTTGELIELDFFEQTDAVKVVAFSKPRLRTAVIDCGKNLENVEIISALLKGKNSKEQLLNQIIMPRFLKMIILISPYILFALALSILIIINN